MPFDQPDAAPADARARLDEPSMGPAEKAEAGLRELAALKELNQRLLAWIESLQADQRRLRDAHQTGLMRATDELSAQRQENAGLSADLAALASRIEELVAASEAATPLRSELGEQSLAAEEESAQGGDQVATLEDGLPERDRQLEDEASWHAETERLRGQLAAANADLKRKEADNARLTAELAALRAVAKAATEVARDNLAAIENQIREVNELVGGVAEKGPAQFAESPPPPYASAVATAAAPEQAAGENGERADPAAIAAPDESGEEPPPTDGVSWSGNKGRIPISLLGQAAGLQEPAMVRGYASFRDLPAAPTGSSDVDTAIVGDADLTANFAHPPTDGSDRSHLWPLEAVAARIADGLKATREEAMSLQEERVFTVDVEKRLVTANSAGELAPLDPALNIHLETAKSELIDSSRGGIRFFPDGTSTGGRVDLEFLGDRAAVNVHWDTGDVTVE